MRGKLEDLLTREMNRKQFLQYMAGLMIVLLGFRNLIEMLTRYDKQSSSPSIKADHGFGTRRFGN